MSTDASLFDALITGNARKVADQLFPRGPQQPMPGTPALVERPSHHDGTRTAGAVDPNYCHVCTPKDFGACRCDIACNE